MGIAINKSVIHNADTKKKKLYGEKVRLTTQINYLKKSGIDQNEM